MSKDEWQGEGGWLVTHITGKDPVFLIYIGFFLLNQLLKDQQLNRKIQDKKVWIHNKKKRNANAFKYIKHSTELKTR